MWECEGITGEGHHQPFKQSIWRGKNAVIVGAGRSMWADDDRIPESWDRVAVNHVITLYRKPIAHAVSIHSELMWSMCLLRKLQCHNGVRTPLLEYSAHGHRKAPDFPELVPWGLRPADGSSSLYALRIAIVLGYKKIVLAGCDMDGSGHFYDPPGLAECGTGYLPPNDKRVNYAHLHQSYAWAQMGKLHGDKIRASGGAPLKWFRKVDDEFLRQ